MEKQICYRAGIRQGKGTVVREPQGQTSGISGKKVAVTGAGGFIGSRIVAALLAEGAQVTAVLRSGHDAARLRAMGARPVVAPLKPGTRLERALSGAGALVNAAHDMRAGLAENLAAFDALLAAAARAGIPRIVHLSSAVVYDDWPDGALSEDSPISTGTGGAYRQAKIAMENKLLAMDIDVAILQPTIVYGPGSAFWTEAPLAALAAGGVVLPDPCGLCPAVHVDDVARAAVLAVAAPARLHDRFLVAGPDSPGWDAFYQGYREIAGRGEILRRPVGELAARLGPDPAGDGGPSAAARLSAVLRRVIGSRRFDRLLARLRPRARGPVWPDPHLLALYRARPEISTARARRALGYVPRVDFASGLAGIARSRRGG